MTQSFDKLLEIARAANKFENPSGKFNYEHESDYEEFGLV